MTSTERPEQKKKISNSIVITSLIVMAILGLSALLHIAHQHGDAYSSGYEMGRIIRKTLISAHLKNGIGLGSVIAVLASWERNKSVLWSILHAIFGWAYVIYFVLTRKSWERKQLK